MIRAGQGLILVAISLLAIGVVMVTSAGLEIGAERPLDLRGLLGGRSALFAGLAVLMLVAGSLVPVDRLARSRGPASPAVWLTLTILVLLVLVHVPGIGREVNGARRWLTLGPVGFQPSEVAKWGLLVVLAWYAARHRAAMSQLGRGLVVPMAIVGVACILIMTEDLGTAVLIGAASLCVLVAAGARLGHVALLLPVAGVAVTAALLHSPYRLARLQAFLDPYADPQGVGYHMIQSMTAVSGGGLAGRGLGNSVQKFGYLPEDTTDFIFAIVCEELGLVGAGLVICLYATLLLCALSIVRRSRDMFAQLLALGIVATIGLQALINLAVVTGSGPTKGIALPLVSSGGTGWLLTAFCIGLLVSIERRTAGPGPAPATAVAAPAVDRTVPCAR